MKKYKVFIGMLATILCLSGCGSSSSEYRGSEVESMGFYTDNAVNSSLSMDYAKEVSYDEVSEDSTSVLDDRKLIRTVSLSVEDGDIEAVEGVLSNTVQEFGGYIQSTYYSEDGEYYNITYRIPSDKVDAFLEKTKAGYDITSLNDNVEDVTLSYTDVESRLASKRAAYKQYQALMDQAYSVEDVVTIQSKMDEITADIESYESQMRTMDNQIDFTRVDVNISTVNNKTSHMFDNLGDEFLDAFEWFVEAVIHLIFILPIVFVVIFVIVKAVRFARRKKEKIVKEKPTVPVNNDKPDNT
jgi:large-conductance mechanosensitive channel